jgi:hypothetical protein
VQQHAAWRLIDVLSARNERGASLLDGKVYLDVISAVARETVNLVDDDIGDVALCLQVREHAPQFRSVGGPRRLASIDEFINDVRVQRLGFAQASIGLGGGTATR